MFHPTMLLRRLWPLCLLLLAAFAPAQEPEAGFSFGVVPQRTAIDLARSWVPILDYLGAKTGYRFEFRTARDADAFEQRLDTGEFDLVYMNPYQYILHHAKHGYRVYAKEKDRLLTGLIVVRVDSPYREVRELDGKTLAFPAASAFAASLLPRAYLSRMGIAYTPAYVASHDSVYIGVSKNLFIAGGGVHQTLNNLAPEIRKQLRVVWVSPPVTPHALAAHPRVPAAAVRRIYRALAEMERDPQGKKLLDDLGFKGIVAAADREYDGVRALEPELRKVRAEK